MGEAGVEGPAFDEGTGAVEQEAAEGTGTVEQEAIDMVGEFGVGFGLKFFDKLQVVASCVIQIVKMQMQNEKLICTKMKPLAPSDLRLPEAA